MDRTPRTPAAGPLRSGLRSDRLAAVCVAVVETLTAVGAAVSVHQPGGLHPLWATNPAAAYLDEAQELLGEGPAVSAFDDRNLVVVPDLGGAEAAQRWPGLASALSGIVVGRYVALPMCVGAIRLGVLSVYSTKASRLSDALVPLALIAADAAAIAAMETAWTQDADQPLAPMGTSVDYLTHQATGMVMVQAGRSAIDAFGLLRARAFQDEVSLSALSAHVVTRQIRFENEEDG